MRILDLASAKIELLKTKSYKGSYVEAHLSE